MLSNSFVKGPLVMFLSALLSAGMAFMVKITAAHIPGPEIAFFRFGFGILICLIATTIGKADLHSSNKKLLIYRGIAIGLCILLYFWAIAAGKLTNSTVLNNSNTIFAVIFASIFLGEVIRWTTLCSLVIAFLGVALLIHPNFQQLCLPDLIALLSALAAGFSTVFVRELRRRGESTWNVFYYMSFVGMLITLIFAIPAWVWPNSRDFINLCLMAAFGIASQLMLTSAYKYCKTATGSIISMSSLVFSSFLGIIVLAERLSTLETCGAGLIILGSFLVICFSAEGSEAKSLLQNIPNKKTGEDKSPVINGEIS